MGALKHGTQLGAIGPIGLRSALIWSYHDEHSVFVITNFGGDFCVAW
jgi:hypothetical protein